MTEIPQPDTSKLRARIAERRAQQNATQEALANAMKPALSVVPNFEPDLVPESDPRSETDEELDRIIDKIDILQAYDKWCGKMKPVVHPGQVEGIKISCPTPGHPDNDPSAWINTREQVWFCGGCQIGGDAIDIAAYHFNYPVPGYKEGARFHELRRDMAEDFGYRFDRLMDGKFHVVAGPVEEQDSVQVTEVEPNPEVRHGILPDDLEPTPEGEAKVVDLYTALEDIETDIVFPHLEWQDIVPQGTFLDTYMQCCILDDVTEEFHFWNGMIALGMALGRDVCLDDIIPVFPNLFVCTLGHSGSGKSKAKWYLDNLLTKALPYKHDDPNSKGTKKVSSPGSAEMIIHMFQKAVPDPANPKVTAYYAPVRGIIEFSELSSMIGRANRAGNVIKPTMMQFYDMEPIVATSSRTAGITEAHEPFACAITTTQPRALRELLGRQDDESGFLNRWIFATGPEKTRMAIGGAAIDITPAVAPLTEIFGWAGSFGPSERVMWSQEAAQLYTDFFHKVIEPDKRRAETELITRIDLTLKKIILLLTANVKEKMVPVEMVEAAIKCYPYLIASYMIPAGQIGNTLQHEIREAVARVASKADRGVSLRDISRTLARKKYPLDLLKKVIELMVAFGELEMSVSKANSVGRPTERFRYVG